MGDLRHTLTGETITVNGTKHGEAKANRSIFDRYKITSGADLREAARKLHGHNTGTMTALAPSNPPVSRLDSSHAPVAQLDRAAVS